MDHRFGLMLPWSPQWWGFSGRALGKGKERRGSWVFLIGSFQARAQQRCWGGRHHVGRRRHQSDSKSLTCGEGSRGKAAPCGILSCLQEHCVVCVLWQALQSDPRVLSIHNQLLQRARIKKAGGGGTVNLHYGTVGKLGQQCCLLYPTVRRKLPMGWGGGHLPHEVEGSYLTNAHGINLGTWVIESVASGCIGLTVEEKQLRKQNPRPVYHHQQTCFILLGL